MRKTYLNSRFNKLKQRAAEVNFVLDKITSNAYELRLQSRMRKEEDYIRLKEYESDCLSNLNAVEILINKIERDAEMDVKIKLKQIQDAHRERRE
jgi:hypothetical protein